MKSQIAAYSKKFGKLRVNRSKARGIAPHKPILLLSVIDQIERGEVTYNQIPLSADLVATFLKYWTTFGSEKHNSDISLPFYHLTGDGFWHLMPNVGFEATIKTRSSIKGLNSLRSIVKYAYFDQALFQLLANAESRRTLTSVLVNTWFSHKEEQVYQLQKNDELKDRQLRLFERGGATYEVDELKDEQQVIIRDAAFRRVVVSIYEQRCAFCHLKIVSRSSQNIVDGAHILPFSEFRDDHFDNGISLCKNHHWAFDRGWFGISDDYKILIPTERFTEQSPDSMKAMGDFDGEEILLPSQDVYKPRQSALEWHRERWNIAA